MLPVALALSILIGVSLGLLGGGGSILTVPILTYAAGMDPKSAITSSLFVVAVTSAAGMLSHARVGRVRWRTGLGFGAAGVIGAYGGGLLAGYIPSRVLMILFGLMMAASAIAMLRKRRVPAPRAHVEVPIAKVVAQGILVGGVTGLVGAGGGFVVVPALVVFGGLPIEAAIGTSLLVITMQSLAGFAGHLQQVDLDWPLTLGVTAAAVTGALVGGAFSHRISAAALRRAFGVLVLVMAAVVLTDALV